MRREAVHRRQLESNVRSENAAGKLAHAIEIVGRRRPGGKHVQPDMPHVDLHDLVLRYPCRFALGKMAGDRIRVDAAPPRQLQVPDGAPLDRTQDGKRLSAATAVGSPHREISGAIANEWHRIRVQGSRDDFTDPAHLDLPAAVVDDFHQNVVIANMIGIALRTLPASRLNSCAP